MSEPTRTPDPNQLFTRLPDASAREQLVILFKPLAEYLARRFQGRGEPLEDLTQVASLALIKAIDRYDLSRGVKFSTYATASIVGEIKRHFRDKGWAVRVPRRLQEAGLAVSKVVVDLHQSLGRSPTVREIAERSGFQEEEVVEAIEAAHAYTAASLDAADDTGVSAIQELGGEDPAIEFLEEWTAVAPALRNLPAREKRLIYLRFVKGRSQMEIAEELGVSQMHVSRLLARTLKFLRESVRGEDESPASANSAAQDSTG